MICYQCGSEDLKYFDCGTRNIKTMNGLVEIKYQIFNCLKCRVSNRTDNDLVPFGNKYGWDIVNYIVDNANRGMKYDRIRINILKKSGFNVCIATIANTRKRFT